MSYMKRAMEEIQERGWPVNNESLKRLEESILKKHGKGFAGHFFFKGPNRDNTKRS